MKDLIKMNRTSAVWLSVLIALIVFVGVNFISGNLNFRVDITQDKLYTLTDGTKKVLENLKQPLTIKYFFSSNHREAPVALKSFGNNVREVLAEYESINPDMVRLEVYSPKPDSDEEEWAVKYGIQGIDQFNALEKYYMGVALISEGQEVSMPWLDLRREQSLEYDLTKSVLEVSRSNAKNLVVLTDSRIFGSTAPNIPGMPMQQEEEPWIFLTELQKAYNIKFLPLSTKEIPDDTDILLVIHPFGVTEATEYSIDQYLMRGGKLIVMVDPFMERDPARTQQMPIPRSSSLPKLFQKWGVEYSEDKIVGDMSLASIVRIGGAQTVPFGLWLNFKKENLNSDLQVMADMDNMTMIYPGGFTLKEDSPLKLTSLMKTTELAGTVSSYSLFAGVEPLKINKQISSDGKAYNIVGLLTGKMQSAFEGEPQQQGQEQTVYKNKFLAEAQEESSIILIADIDFLHESYSANVFNLFGQRMLRFTNQNLPLLLNLIDFSSGSTELIEIRSRGNFMRPFIVFEEMEKSAQNKLSVEETRLQADLNQIQENIKQLQPDNAGEVKLSRDVVEQINRYRESEIEARKKLKEVRKLLRQDIDFLKMSLTLLNLLVVPALVIAGGIIIYLRRSKIS